MAKRNDNSCGCQAPHGYCGAKSGNKRSETQTEYAGGTPRPKENHEHFLDENIPAITGSTAEAIISALSQNKEYFNRQSSLANLANRVAASVKEMDEFKLDPASHASNMRLQIDKAYDNHGCLPTAKEKREKIINKIKEAIQNTTNIRFDELKA